MNSHGGQSGTLLSLVSVGYSNCSRQAQTLSLKTDANVDLPINGGWVPCLNVGKGKLIVHVTRGLACDSFDGTGNADVTFRHI